LLDTGDGVAICFLGDPEDALFVALDVRSAFREAEVDGRPFPSLRIGINLGPARTAKDLAGRVNFLGDGINVGQRIMSFCEPDQILVSRSYFEVVGCLSSKHASMFKYLGARQDKHVREHVVYEVSLAGEGEESPPPIAVVAPVPEFDPDPADLVAAEEALVPVIGPLAHLYVARTAKASTSREALFATLAASIPAGPQRDHFLARFAPSPDAEPAVHSPAAEAVGSDQKPVSADSSRPWTSADLEQAELALAPHLGPLAGLLVQRASRRCGEVGELVAALAKEIREEDRRQAFLASAPR
jgi:hypothetical protein